MKMKKRKVILEKNVYNSGDIKLYFSEVELKANRIHQKLN